MKIKILSLLVLVTYLFLTCEEENTTSGTFRDSRDDHDYKWVMIGDQVWMAENLAYLPSVCPPSSSSDTEPCFYVYVYYGTSVSEARSKSAYSTYGVLYNWPAAMNGATSISTNPSGVKGICPDGWHLPSDAEWTQLTDYLGGEIVAGGKLKEAGVDYWSPPNTGADNSSDFSALPGGYCYDNGDFFNEGYSGIWWSATEKTATDAWYRELYYSTAEADRYYFPKAGGFSIRCVRDD